MNSDLFCYNQVEMLLEKYKKLLGLSVKQLIIQSSLASLISLGQTMWCVKNQNLGNLGNLEKLGNLCIQQELSKPKSNLVLLKGNNKSKSLSRKVA